jgi:hypothetical protein
MRLEFVTADINITIFWNVMPCILVMLIDISDESFACFFRVKVSSSVEEKGYGYRERDSRNTALSEERERP